MNRSDLIASLKEFLEALDEMPACHIEFATNEITVVLEVDDDEVTVVVDGPTKAFDASKAS